jgi:hypothetical protein
MNSNVIRSAAVAARTAVLVALAGALLMVAPVSAAGHGNKHKGSPEADLRMAMRSLWEDHVTWTRLVIVSTAADLPDREATTARLLQNQQAIGDAVKPFYGDAAGDRLAALLREHIVGAANLLAAAKSGDAGRVDQAKLAWYANGDEIASFLAGANPRGWPLDDMRSMMRTHLDLTLSEAVNQLQGHYPESVADYDRARAEILDMAGMLADGILQQFPSQF